MDKDKSGTNSWKDNSGAGGGNSSDGSAGSTISQGCLSHSTVGEYTSTNRHKSGGHGQDSLNYMDENGIDYEINIEYNNGVRAGNIPNSKQSFARTGNNHTWFPKNWSEQDIEKAGKQVADSFTGTKGNGVTHSGIVNGVNVTVMFNSSGEVATIYPSKDQPGGIKE